MRSLMKSIARVGDRTEPWGTLLLIDLGEEQWLSTTAAIERSERKLNKAEEKRIETVWGQFCDQSFVPDLIKRF